jgi:hypothetical protein
MAGLASVKETYAGQNALALAQKRGMTLTRWLLKHGGATIEQDNCIWETLCFWTPGRVTDLLRIMVLRGSPPAWLSTRVLDWSPEHAQVVEEGARLMARLPKFRRDILDACLLPAIRVIVDGYDPEITDIEELWATGLGTDPAPAYLARRWALLNEHLPPPLRAAIHEYEGPPTTEELLNTDIIAHPTSKPRESALLESLASIPLPSPAYHSRRRRVVAESMTNLPQRVPPARPLPQRRQ